MNLGLNYLQLKSLVKAQWFREEEAEEQEQKQGWVESQ